jgi:hypothetical protein
MLLIRTNSGVSVTMALSLFLLPLGPPRATLCRGGWRLLGFCFGLAGRFLHFAAHDLLNADRERAPFLDADQREGKEGQAWHRLAVQTGKETIQAVGVLACFGDHHFIASQEVDSICMVHMLTKEPPQQHPPRQSMGEKPLHGTIAAAVATPACHA